MAISLKHSFTSLVADEGDASVVRPSNWNAEHTMTAASGTLVGRTTAGTGAVEEVVIGSGLLNSLAGYLTIVSGSGTVTLTNTSSQIIYVSGTATQTIVLPDVTTLQLGWTFTVFNGSTNNVTVQSSGLNSFTVLPAGQAARLICIATTGTTTASWVMTFEGSSSRTGTGGIVYATSPALFGPTINNARYTLETITAGTNAQGQGALASSTEIAAVTTTAANPSGVTLNTAAAGKRTTVFNLGTNPIVVYPLSGTAINGLAANAGVTIPVGYSLLFEAQTATQWRTQDLGTSGQFLESNGASSAPTWTNIASTDVSGLGTLATQSGTFSGTSSGTNTGDQNLFSTIAVSGQSDVVADSTSDTLTLVAGTNVTITTDAGTDTITIPSSGGGASPLTLVDTTTFDSSGTYTVPAGANIFKVHMWGGGGSGGEGSNGAPGGGGGGGAFVEAWFGSVTLAGASTLAVVVGAGGAAQTSSNSNGNVGGTTTIGGATGAFAFFRAFGGGGGGQNSSGGGGGGGGGHNTAGGTGSGTTAGTAGGFNDSNVPKSQNVGDSSYIPFANAYSVAGIGAIPISNSNVNMATRYGAGTAGGGGSATGAPGVDTSTTDKVDTSSGSDTFAGGAGGGGGRDSAGSAAVNRGGNALWGGAGGGGAATSVVGGNGGTSTYGGAGGAGAVDANNATAGSQPGGGGGGSEAGNSGAGGAGRVIIYAYNFA